MPDLKQFERFVAVAEELNFRRAAERLHMSQPPLSEAIQRLEEELGTRLFERDRRHVALTEPGRVFLGRARLVLAEAAAAAAAAREAGRGRVGLVTVGFFPSATYDILPTILRTFAARHPSAGLSLGEFPTTEQPEALLAKRIDVGLFLAPTFSVAGLRQEILRQEPLVVILPADHRLAAEKEVPLEALRAEPFIFIPPRRGTGYHARVSNACEQAGFAPRVVHEVEQIHTLVSLVAAGMGVALGAQSLRRFQPPGAVFRRLADPSPLLRVDFGIAWREGDGSPVLHAFLAAAREACGRTANGGKDTG